MAIRKLEFMTAKEFSAVTHLLNISDDRLAAAREVLVEGQTYQAVADKYGWTTRQYVLRTAQTVLKKYEEFKLAQQELLSDNDTLPEGWEVVNCIAPSNLASEFKRAIHLAEPKT